MKILNWIWDNLLFIFTVLLLAFIPLYPKLPLKDVPHTWVYIRAEDLIVLLALVVLFIQVVRKKITLKTPLTIPIIFFWLIGIVSTIYAIIFIFPHLANQFPNVAIFHYLRRIEYLSVFFVAYVAFRGRKSVSLLSLFLGFVLLAVVAYGIGQRLYGLPAFLTMNEEFAKGIPLRLSAAARIPSTFAGHYDLAAYLVLLIPLMGSMIFGFRNIFMKFFFFLTALCGLVLLLMTESRVSFAVYLFAMVFMLILQKQKKFIIPVVIGSIILLNSFQGISERFGSTITQADLVVDARTGKPLGIAKKSLTVKKKTQKKAPVVIEESDFTGEDLPQGTGYINLPSQPEYETVTQVSYIRRKIKAGTESAQITNIEGEFVIKQVLAYDVSFTTRFQGEWPRAFEAFKRNILLGSGYSSINLATDNDYLRTLGEVGLLGLSSFLLIFLIFGIYIGKILPSVDSHNTKSFVLGVVAGIFGLTLNAVLIDVFEASKVAFVLWLLMGITLGVLYSYQSRPIQYIKELVRVVTSTPTLIIVLLISSFSIFWVTLGNYFVGDDFTWLRWAADCKRVLYKSGLVKCEPIQTIITNYFSDASGFFYRPGTKLYFLFMYSIIWLNNGIYHAISIFLHFTASSFVFLLGNRILKNRFFALVAAVFFLVLSGHSEAIFWISTTGHLVASVLVLSSVFFYIYWQEKKSLVYLFFSVISFLIAPLFHEFGIVTPLFIILYDLTLNRSLGIRSYLQRWYNLLYLIPIPVYLMFRYLAKSHWFSGDYSYSLSDLPFNIIGNIFGYTGLALFGTKFLSLYSQLRVFGRENIAIVVAAIIFISIIFVLLYKFLFRFFEKNDIQKIIFCLGFFIVSLLPFLGLGNISPRYLYLASAGLMLLLAFTMQKAFYRLRNLDIRLAAVFFSLAFLAFFLFHLLGIYRINQDWNKAGKVTNKLLVDFNDVFQTARATPQNPVFHFVNVPIKYGEAWIFPVGLKDALWFTFQNEYLTVNTSPSLDLALDAAEGSASAKVFEFDNNGSAYEVTRNKKIFTVPKKK